MTEKTTKVNISELSLIRITCIECGITTESPIKDAHKTLKKQHCVFCHAENLHEDDLSLLTDLDRTLDRLARLSPKIQINFVIDDSSD